MSYLLRVVLPDRPGSLGAVASAIGLAGGDIVSVDIVERFGAEAVDDIVVDVGHGKLPDGVISAAQRLPGVRVESIRPFDGALSTHRELGLLEAMAADPTGANQLLVDEVPWIFRSGWALVLDSTGTLEVRSDGAPDEAVAIPDWTPVTKARLVDVDIDPVPAEWGSLDTSLMAAPSEQGYTVVAGRPGGPDFRASEVHRFAHLVGLAGTIRRTTR